MTTPPLPPVALPGQQGVEAHRQMSRRQMFQAGKEWDEGDRIQASEKAWGAFAHILKAIAIQRGWQHDRHDLVEDIGEQIASELNKPDLGNTVSLANRLHRNFYQHYMGMHLLAEAIGDVEGFVQEMEVVLRSPPRYYVIRDAAAQYRLGMLLGYDPEYTIPRRSYSTVGFSKNHPEPDSGAFQVFEGYRLPG